MASEKRDYDIPQFDFFLNQQGAQGKQGEKGDEGFSPTIQIGQNNIDAFTLLVTNVNGTYETPNLRQQITDLGGTYVRRNLEDGTLYAGEADIASNSQRGLTKYATTDEVNSGSEDTALTPSGMQDYLEANYPNNQDVANVARVDQSNTFTQNNTFNNPTYFQNTYVNGTLYLNGASLAFDNAGTNVLGNFSKPLEFRSTDANIRFYRGNTKLVNLVDSENIKNYNFVDTLSEQTIEGVKTFDASVKARTIFGATKTENIINFDDGSIDFGRGTYGNITAKSFTAGSQEALSRDADTGTLFINGGADDDVLIKTWGGGKVEIQKGSAGTPHEIVDAGNFASFLPIASSTQLGCVKVDGTTITADADGTIHSVGGSGAIPNPLELSSTSTNEEANVVYNNKIHFETKDGTTFSAYYEYIGTQNGVPVEGDKQFFITTRKIVQGDGMNITKNSNNGNITFAVGTIDGGNANG